MVKSYKDGNFPLDVVYFDIDYMDSYGDFTVDNITYGGALNFSEYLH